MFGTVRESLVIGNCFLEELDDSGSANELEDCGSADSWEELLERFILIMSSMLKELLVIATPANIEEDIGKRGRFGCVALEDDVLDKLSLLEFAVVAELLDSVEWLFSGETDELLKSVYLALSVVPLELDLGPS